MSEFRSHPDPATWDDYVDFESTSWPKKDRRHYWIIPSVCFNCESACGILAYVDKEQLTVRKIEGNPLHPGSRGRTCAKGVVTPNQLEDPDRILYPLCRDGERGSGKWRQVSWDEALTEIGGRIRKAILENRRHELMYHVGRPGEDGYANRVLQAWGIDGHNSHTNVCSSSARLGHFLWCGNDRPSPDYANAQTILLLSSHLETGHYFNPHAQRIIEGQANGATLIVIDPRLSNTSAKANLCLPAVLSGSVGTEGGVGLHLSNKFVPAHPTTPPPPEYWNELLFPREYPLAFFEMSFLLPHLLKEKRGKLDVYFTRVYNPVWTNPDGFSWMEMLTDRDTIGLHVALTPSWSETAWFADYILPMGLGTVRHDTMSQETHAAQWLGFRQPVLRVAREKRGEQINATYEANPGEVWEESEFWAALTWRIDPDGSLGIRKHFESPYRPGEPVTMDEYYGWMFENSVPGLPDAAAAEGLTPLAYMRKYGVFKVKDNVYKPYEQPLPPAAVAGATTDSDGLLIKDGQPIGLMVDRVAMTGFSTPSRR